jgi:hypothetical protein
MYCDIISATYKGDYKLEIFFADGKSGIVDFRKYIERGGVFKNLEDLEYFRKFMINHELGVITWNNEVDVAPETIYSEATGEPLPNWMEKTQEMQKSA